MGKTKILVVGDPGSIHTARFVNLLQEIGYNIRIFQSEFISYQDEHLHNTVIYVYFPLTTPINNNILKFFCPMELDSRFILPHKNISIALQTFKEILRNDNKQPRVNDLIKVLNYWKPEIVLSLKMQNDGYTVSRAKDILKNRFPSKWVHFCWGTDIEFFGKDKNYSSEHLPKIKRLLERCDFLLADSERDVNQVSKYSFKGTNLGQLLANGGFDLLSLSKIKTKYRRKRDTILIKGREGGYGGKAYNILAALHRIPNLIKEYKVKIIMATPEIENVVYFLKKFDGINYEIIPKIPYQQLLRLFAQSRIAISATTVDGTPSFLIEAITMGAFPIHSDMESVREWVKSNMNGLIFPIDDISQLTACIKKALVDDQLVNRARIINWRIAESRMDRRKIKIQVKNLIEKKIINSNLKKKSLINFLKEILSR